MTKSVTESVEEEQGSVFARRITTPACLQLFGEWGLTCQLIASAEVSSFIIAPIPHLDQRVRLGLWPLSPPLVWPPVWLVEPHQQHITAPQCRYKLEEFGGSLKWTPLLLFLSTETPLKNQLARLFPPLPWRSHNFRNRWFPQCLRRDLGKV